MPRIPDEFLDTAIYLYASHADAVAGTRTGGSGFLTHLDLPGVPGRGILYAVTNAHVIEQGSCTVRLNTQSGETDIIDLDERHWLMPSTRDDIAVAAIGLDRGRHKIRTLDAKEMVTKQIAEEYAVGPGDDVFVVGRFVNAEGRQKNLPTLRFGNIAQMPLEKIKQTRVFGDHEQESYLVEARTISGYSGSPVCLLMLPHFKRPGRPDLETDHVRLLGVVWGYIQDWERVCGENGKPLDNKHQVKSNTGMMAVVPAWQLFDLLNMPILVAHREQAKEDYLKTLEPPVATLASASPDSALGVPLVVAGGAAPPANGENPTHLEDFTRLVSLAARKPESKD
jgi:hypothetical protein